MPHHQPVSPAPQAGPFADQHEALQGQIQICISRLDGALRALHTDAPSALAAARQVAWSGPAALVFTGLVDGTEFTRTLLIDTATTAKSHYVAASNLLTATA